MSSFVRVLGSADWHVTKNNDQSYYILNDHVLLDRGGAHAPAAQGGQHGPKEQLREAVRLCLTYAFWDSPDYLAEVMNKPKLVELSGGERLEVKGLLVDTISSDHAVPGVCYRVTDPVSGGSIGFTGDTRYRAEYADFFHDVDILFHECSMGEGPLPPRNEQCRHSSAIEAARVCNESGAKKLALVHCFEENREAALNKARTLTDTPVVWAEPYTVHTF